jgi:hypothetical protein
VIAIWISCRHAGTSSSAVPEGDLLQLPAFGSGADQHFACFNACDNTEHQELWFGSRCQSYWVGDGGSA